MSLPQEFVYLRDIDTGIRSDLRYTLNENFIGNQIPGYNDLSPVILTRAAAIALSEAQKLFNKDGYDIIIYDAYRPQRSVNYFFDWSKDVSKDEKKIKYFPRISKQQIFDLGYISPKSGHSRGSTVDISIIPIDKENHPIIIESRKLNDNFEILYLDDGTLDMGSSFDLFDAASHPVSNLIKPEHQKNRNYLRNIMESCGWKVYPTEWWHFTLENETFLDKYFNFQVCDIS